MRGKRTRSSRGIGLLATEEGRVEQHPYVPTVTALHRLLEELVHHRPSEARRTPGSHVPQPGLVRMVELGVEQHPSKQAGDAISGVVPHHAQDLQPVLSSDRIESRRHLLDGLPGADATQPAPGQLPQFEIGILRGLDPARDLVPVGVGSTPAARRYEPRSASDAPVGLLRRSASRRASMAAT